MHERSRATFEISAISRPLQFHGTILAGERRISIYESFATDIINAYNRYNVCNNRISTGLNYQTYDNRDAFRFHRSRITVIRLREGESARSRVSASLNRISSGLRNRATPVVAATATSKWTFRALGRPTAAASLFLAAANASALPGIASRDVTGPASTGGLSYAIARSCWTGSLTHINVTNAWPRLSVLAVRETIARDERAFESRPRARKFSRTRLDARASPRKSLSLFSLGKVDEEMCILRLWFIRQQLVSRIQSLARGETD